MGSHDLRDRLYREMADSQRPWQADEIARVALKIVSDSARAKPLVQAILGGDPRFVDRDGIWCVRDRSAPRLSEHLFLLCEAVPTGSPDAPPAILMEVWDPAAGRVSEPVLVAADSAGIESTAEMLEGAILASLGAPASRRALHRLERLCAIPSMSERMIDLGAAIRAAGLRPPEPPAPGEIEDLEAALIPGRLALRTMIDHYGSGSLEDLEDTIQASVSAEPVDFTRFRFDRSDLEAIPARPGLYRFEGENGRLLYIGKSRDLRRRLSEYFRPLASDHRRRARLLAEIRELSWETCPCELEALILESVAIRTLRPPFNQQIEIHAEPRDGEEVGGDLGFVLCEGDPDQVSVFLLRDGEAWGWGRVSRGSVEAARADGEFLLDCWGKDGEDPERGVRRCGAEEAALVRRYLRLYGDRLDRIEPDALSDSSSALAAIVALSLRERPAWDPWMLRARLEA